MQTTIAIKVALQKQAWEHLNMGVYIWYVVKSIFEKYGLFDWTEIYFVFWNVVDHLTLVVTVYCL